MGWLMEVAFGVCLIILCSGLINYLNTRARAENKQAKKDKNRPDDAEQRLQAIEQRLTDVQDVMIALSEKIDRMDEEQRYKTD